MEAITDDGLEALSELFNEEVNTLMDDFMEKFMTPLRGRTVTTIRKFKDTSGEFKEHTVTVTIEGGRFDYDGGLVLVGTYPHPYSGKPVITDIMP